MNASKSYVSFRLYGTAFCMRLNGEKVFSNFFFFSGGHIQTVSMRLKNIGSKRTNEKVRKFPERSATLRNFVGFQIFIVKPLFPFLSFISPFTKKGVILFSINTMVDC